MVQRFRKRKLKSPLIWIGGKSRALEKITSHFPPVTEMVFPFLGGGSIEVHMAGRGVRVHAYDIDPRLVNFWQYTLRDPVRVRIAAREFWPITNSERYNKLFDEMMRAKFDLRGAALFYVVARFSYSGDVYGSGRNTNGRFTRRLMHDLDLLAGKPIRVLKRDFRVSLAINPDLFAYIDPPYLMEREYYCPEAKDFAHNDLAAILKNRGNWIMSNRNNEAVRDLYAGFHIKEVQWKYGVGTDKKSQELLIFSHDLKP